VIADPTKIEPFAGFGEPVSSVTHLVAAAVFTALAIRLIRRGAGHAGRVFALSIYAAAVIFQLVISGVYHLLPPGSIGNEVLLRIDHAAIFFLIAATFTAIHGILFRGAWRWGVLAFIWSAAVSGIVLKTVFSAQTPLWFGASLYAGLGWVGIISGVLAWRQFGFRFMAPMLYGGIAYTAGLLLEWAMAEANVFQLIPHTFGGHELFHLAVIAGIAIHWYLIDAVADGELPRPTPSCGA
jgi:channel protein (hemolysin III family)